MDGSQSVANREAPASKEQGLWVAKGPVLVFGGCYSNLEATKALLEIVEQLQIPPGNVICTGDVVAYGADPRETVRIVRQSGIRVVMGNCEESLGNDAEDCGCGYAEGSTCDQLSTTWYAHARAQLSESDRTWMRGLPRRIDITIGGRKLAVVHGGIETINAFVFASSGSETILREIDVSQCDGIIGGHCGLPFSRIVDGRLWHNSGAIGMPANDGTPRTWYSLLCASPDGIVIEHRPLSYQHKNAANKMRACGLPEGYADALETGYWPSCDVLPADELQRRGTKIEPAILTWPSEDSDSGVVWPPLSSGERPAKFSDPDLTSTGERRASVALTQLNTLWFNTGTLCNLACKGCYIESSPRNDRLAYLSRTDVAGYLTEIQANHRECTEIGFTGGEPFMNPELLGMIEDTLAGGWRALVLTNAMKPMQHERDRLLRLHRLYPGRLSIRVSLDHYSRSGHEDIRGRASWQPAIKGLVWLAENGFDIAIASRTISAESEQDMRAGFSRLFADLAIPINSVDPTNVVLFPEMDDTADVPEITERCWGILNVDPGSIMCATSRMVLKRKGATKPSVISCTLLPYDEAFDMGTTLAEASGAVKLNHPHCARFCVLGGASCSAGRSS